MYPPPQKEEDERRRCDTIEEETLDKLRAAWDSSEQKDECIVCLNDLERAYWMGTEIGQLGGYGFQGVTLGVDGSCKEGKMGSKGGGYMCTVLTFYPREMLLFIGTRFSNLYTAVDTPA
jgi:hypothetical protein